MPRSRASCDPRTRRRVARAAPSNTKSRSATASRTCSRWWRKCPLQWATTANASPLRTAAPFRLTSASSDSSACDNSTELGDVLAEDLLHLEQLGPSLQGVAHVTQGAGDVRQERRVLLHPVDEHESAGVLQLALHGEQIEEPHEVARFQRLPAFRLEGLQVARQHRVDERPIQLDVAVPQQSDKVVLPRALQRVLEVDHHLL